MRAIAGAFCACTRPATTTAAAMQHYVKYSRKQALCLWVARACYRWPFHQMYNTYSKAMAILMSKIG